VCGMLFFRVAFSWMPSGIRYFVDRDNFLFYVVNDVIGKRFYEYLPEVFVFFLIEVWVLF
jgi:hypothetical protein